MSTSSTVNPLAEIPTATELFYCGHCGHVDMYLARLVERMKQPPNCPVDNYPQKPMDAADADPALK